MAHFLIAFFFVAHGAVHPLLSYHPTRDQDEIVGGLWRHSWLFGDGQISKRIQWIGSFLTLALFAIAGLSVMGWIIPQDWWQILTILAAGMSLLLLVVYWFTEFFIGVGIDLILLGAVMFAI